jgi:hypothetical protein
VNTFFEDLGARCAEVAARQGAAIEPPRLGNEEAAALLDLARVAAHTQERRFAPLASYLLGIAVERARQARSAGGPGEPGDAAALIREVRLGLEEEGGPEPV